MYEQPLQLLKLVVEVSVVGARAFAVLKGLEARRTSRDRLRALNQLVDVIVVDFVEGDRYFLELDTTDTASGGRRFALRRRCLCSVLLHLIFKLEFSLLWSQNLFFVYFRLLVFSWGRRLAGLDTLLLALT